MTPANPPTGPAESTALVLPLNDVAHLFNAPPIDPLSDSPLEGLGISGVEHLLSLLHLDKPRQRTRVLTLLLPAEKAAAASAGQLANALHRYAGWRIEREHRDRRNTFRYGWKVTGFALVMLTTCLALSSLFASDLTEWMRPLIRKTFESGFEIIGWVVLWHPIEILVYSPVAIRARQAALQTLASAAIVIRAAPPPDAAHTANQ